jgi:hypothetical protein
MNAIVPVVLFAYARPNHLLQTLKGLRDNQVPLIYAFSDGPQSPEKEPAVVEVGKILRAIEWCEVVLYERNENLGLGKSILTGVGQVLKEHDAAIIFEDDLFCMPGTYRYLAAALRHYWDDPRVMSVTGWTHPCVTPSNMMNQPYFDGRAECWVWGTWARAWNGMKQDAKSLMQACAAQGLDVYRYGSDLAAMAEVELQKNIWAVRFLYLHMLHSGLCLRPPYSMVEHIGFDADGTNAKSNIEWANPPLKPCPPLPDKWPVPDENPECPCLWQRAARPKPIYLRLYCRVKHAVKKMSALI